MYSVGATNSTTEWLSSDLCHLSAGWLVSWFQSNSWGTSFDRLHIVHFHRFPPSINVT